MIEHLQLALSSLQTALALGKSLVGLKNSAETNSKLKEITGAIIEANGRIIESQKIQSVLSTEINELKQECMRLKNWDANEKNRYVRKQIALGVFAYVAHDFIGNFQDAHKYCCNCFDKTIKSTLQQSVKPIGGYKRVEALVCPNSCPDLEFLEYSENT